MLMAAEALWTPLRVTERISEALRVVLLTGGRVGPQAFGSVWPEYRREFSDKTHRKFDEWMDDVERQAARRFSAAELSRADEALGWPLELIDHALMRDALWLVCLARASAGRVEVKAVLARRRRLADAMVVKASAGAPDVIRIYEDEAQAIAVRVAGWANKALQAPLRDELRPRVRTSRRGRPSASADEISRLTDQAVSARNRRIRSGARLLFARGVKEMGTIERVVRVKRADVMPGVNFNFAPCYRWFDRGASAISAALMEREVPVR